QVDDVVSAARTHIALGQRGDREGDVLEGGLTLLRRDHDFLDRSLIHLLRHGHEGQPRDTRNLGRYGQAPEKARSSARHVGFSPSMRAASSIGRRLSLVVWLRRTVGGLA